MATGEVPFRPTRQSSFTDEQRWLLLAEYDQCLERGAKAAFRRRVGVANSTMDKWLMWREQGRLVDPATRPATTMTSVGRYVLNYEERRELARLRRENARLKKNLEQSTAANQILGKAAALLEELAKSATPNPVNDPDSDVEDSGPGRPAWLADPSTSSLPPIPSRRCDTPE